MAQEIDSLINQLKQNKVHYELYSYLKRDNSGDRINGKSVNVPIGESEEGLFLNWHFIFDDCGTLRSVDLESD